MWRTRYCGLSITVSMLLVLVVSCVSTSFAVVVGSGAFSPSATVINFDDVAGGTEFNSGTVITNQYSSLGATFVNPDYQSHATSAVTSLFPGASSPNVLLAIQHGGNIIGRPQQIIFSTPMLRVGMLFEVSADATITMSAFSPGGLILESTTMSGILDGAFQFGFIGFQEETGIGHVELSSASTSTRQPGAVLNFSIDNVTFEPVPEPSILALLTLGSLGLLAHRRFASKFVH